jgi:hypothetical protein
MNTYNLKTVNEATIIGDNLSTISYVIPIDDLGNIPDYLAKDRIIKNGQMLVFNTRQEYLDYLESNP